MLKDLENNIKCRQLADDTSLFLKYENDINAASNVIEEFYSFSGLKLNSHKTKLMKIGHHIQDDIVTPFEIVDKIKILGIVFENGKRAIDIDENWTGRIEKLTRIIQLWSKRDLSIMGKNVIVNFFLVSQLIYVMQSIGLPEKVLIDVNRLFYKFIWQKRFSNRKAFEKVKRVIVEGNIEDGGLKMVNVVHLQKAFYLQWVGKLAKSREEKWTHIPRWWFSKLANGFGVFNFNCRSKDVKGLDKIKNGFWKAVLCTLTTDNEINSENVYFQQLWNNSLIQYKYNLLFYPQWKRQGIEYIKDITKDNEKRLLTLEEIKQIIVSNRGSTVLDYNAIINAIPKHWLDWISANKQTTELEIDQVTIKKLDQYLKKPTDLLKLIVNKDNIIPCSVGFWQHKLQIHITDCNWNLAKKCTKEIRLLVLHWKILHNIYPTNILLHRMEISENRNCKFCTDEIDYIEHFFWSCGKINLIWKKSRGIRIFEI